MSGDRESQVTKTVRKWKKDSLLAHCLARAVIADMGGVEAAETAWGPKAERLSKWAATKAGIRATPKGTRVAGFVVMWAIAMRDEKKDGYSITEYQRYWYEGERQAYRLQKEFRELWPEYETPNELARQIVAQVNAKLSKREMAMLPSTLQVEAAAV
jgi:hypothetical protein